jgi:hypothetical protein
MNNNAEQTDGLDGWMDGWMIVPLADLSYLKIDQFLIDGVL